MLGFPGFHESFWAFLPTFFTRFDRFNWQHLWFLIYPYSFTLLYLLLFRRLAGAKPRGQKRVHPASVYLPLLPLALAQVLLRSRWPGYQNLFGDWANFAYYSLYLSFGFLLAARPSLFLIRPVGFPRFACGMKAKAKTVAS